VRDSLNRNRLIRATGLQRKKDSDGLSAVAGVLVVLPTSTAKSLRVDGIR